MGNQQPLVRRLLLGWYGKDRNSTTSLPPTVRLALHAVLVYPCQGEYSHGACTASDILLTIQKTSPHIPPPTLCPVHSCAPISRAGPNIRTAWAQRGHSVQCAPSLFHSENLCCQPDHLTSLFCCPTSIFLCPQTPREAL